MEKYKTINSSEQDIGLRTFYARADIEYRSNYCCAPITFMNKRGVFEIEMHSDEQTQVNHNEVVAITFDPITRAVIRVANAIYPDLRVLMDDTSPHYIGSEIKVRGYWRKPNKYI